MPTVPATLVVVPIVLPTISAVATTVQLTITSTITVPHMEKAKAQGERGSLAS